MRCPGKYFTETCFRYQTEGSRGAIKDKSGAGHPSVKLDGYNRAAKIQVFIGTDSGRISPHLFYQVCRVTGKHSSPCEEVKINGTDVIEIVSDPTTDNLVICDCVGILKERFADVEQRFPKHKSWKSSKKKSTKCRMVFRTSVESSSGETEVLQVVSDVINCTQLPGTPEILKMSLSSSPVQGGEELWIIGKNFMKDTKIVFSQTSPGKEEPLWSKTTDPESEFFHATHLITRVPPFYNLDLSESVEINIHIKCGDKVSDSVQFSYSPSPSSAAASSSSSSVPPPVLPTQPLCVNTHQFPVKGSVSVITGLTNGKVTKNEARSVVSKVVKSDTISHNHKSKKSKMDFNSKNRRTRSVPRPNLIEEDTVFVTEKVKPSTSNLSNNTVMTSFSQFSWKDNPVPVRNTQDSVFTQKFSSPVALRMRNSLSVSVDDESRTFSQDDHHEETSFHSPTPAAEFSSSLTRDFSGAINIKTSETETSNKRLSFTGVMTQVNPAPLVTQLNTSPVIQETQQQQQQSSTSCQQQQQQQQSSFLAATSKPAPPDTDNTPNVSVTKSDEDKATISISLPTSILKNQKHFQSVIETINNTLLTKNNAEDETKTSNNNQDQQSPDKTWFTENHQEQPLSPSRKITSMPVSVLSTVSNARKRNISSELVNTVNSGEILSNTSPVYTEHLSPTAAADQMSSAATSPYTQVTTSPVTSAESAATSAAAAPETAQEKKWNAEFNEVLQSVIEQDRVSGMDWTPAVTAASNEWTTPAVVSVASNNWTSPAVTAASSNDWATSSAVSDNSSKSWAPAVTTAAVASSQWTTETVTAGASNDWTSPAPVNSWPAAESVVEEVVSADTSDWTQSAAGDWTSAGETAVVVTNSSWTPAVSESSAADAKSSMDWSSSVTKSVVTPVTSTSTGFIISSSSAVPVLSIPDNVVVTTAQVSTQPTVVTVQPGLAVQQQQQCLPVQQQQQQQCISVPVQDFIQPSPDQSNFTSFTTPPSISSLSSNLAPVAESSAISNNDPLLFEVDSLKNIKIFQDNAPIQGDPLLSEASSVIELQKTIENAGGAGAEQSSTLGSEIPTDQQWVSTPQSSDWT